MKKNITKFLFCCGLILISLNKLHSINDKGETDRDSPLSFLLQEKDTLFKVKLNKAQALFDAKEYSKSLNISLGLLDNAKEENDLKTEYFCSLLTGNSFMKMNNHDKALIYFNRSLKILLNSQGFLDIKENNFDLSFINDELIAKNLLKIGSEFFRLGIKDSATTYYKKVVDMPSFVQEVAEVKASAYNNLSAVYMQDSLYDKARAYSLKALEIKRKTNDKLSVASALGNLASIYAFEKDYKKSKEIYLEALDLIENDNSSTAFRYKKDLYFNLAWALYNLKDFTAYNYQEKSYDIKDSLRNAEVEHIVQQVYEKYQFDIAEKQASKAEAEVALEKAQERKTNWFLGAVALLILISSGVILYNYKLRQNNLKLKLSQTQLAQKSKLEKLKSESQVRILNATLDGKETERKQIAETLHDSVSSLLSSANLHLQATKMQFNGDSPIEIDKTQKIIVEASQTIRDLSHTLVSSVLLKFGLKYAIKDMAEKYSNSQIQINTDIKNLRRYHQSFEIKVNNIIQEFVNNILKHSNASKSIVRVEDKSGKLIISIQDNGDGFDKSLIPEKDGLGINQIDARIQMMKGDFKIDSNAENGTKIDIILPILEKESPIRV